MTSDHSTVEQLLKSALEGVQKDLPQQEYQDVSDYIEYGEYGVAWELLVHVLVTQNLQLSDDIIRSGQMMGLELPAS